MSIRILPLSIHTYYITVLPYSREHIPHSYLPLLCIITALDTPEEDTDAEDIEDVDAAEDTDADAADDLPVE
jgi:hypothetical protein